MFPDDVKRLRSTSIFSAHGFHPCPRCNTLVEHLQAERELLRAEVDKLRACREELRQVTEAMDDPRVHNTMTLVEAVRELVGKRDAR